MEAAGAQFQQQQQSQQATAKNREAVQADTSAETVDSTANFQQHSTTRQRQTPSNFSMASSSSNSYRGNGSHGDFMPHQQKHFQQQQHFGNRNHYGGRGNFSNDESYGKRNYQNYDSRQNYKYDMNSRNNPKHIQNYQGGNNTDFNRDVNNNYFYQQRQIPTINTNVRPPYQNKPMQATGQGFNPAMNPMPGAQLVFLMPAPNQFQLPAYANKAQAQYIRMNQKNDVKQSAEDKIVNDDLSKLLSDKLAGLTVASDNIEKSSSVIEKTTVKEKPTETPVEKDIDLGILDNNISKQLTKEVFDRRIDEQIISTIKIVQPEQKPASDKIDPAPSAKKIESVPVHAPTSSAKGPMVTKTDAGNTNWSSSKLEGTSLVESHPARVQNNDRMPRVQSKSGSSYNSNHQNRQNYESKNTNYSRPSSGSYTKANQSSERINLTTQKVNVAPQPVKTQTAQASSFSFSNKKIKMIQKPIKSIPLADNSKIADCEVPVNSLIETNTTDTNTEAAELDNTMASTSASSKIHTRSSVKSVAQEQDQSMSSLDVEHVKSAHVEPPKLEIKKPAVEPSKPEFKPKRAVGQEIKFDLNDFIEHVVIFPVEECFENLPIIFRKFGSKSITFAKITSMDFEKDIADSYNIKQTSSELDKRVRELRGNLNKITEGNYRQLSEVVFKCIKNSPDDEITSALADAFYRKSIVDECFLNLYAKMIVKIQELGCATFIYQLKNYISCFAEPSSFNTEKIANLKEELKSAPAEKQEIVEEDLNIAITQQKKRYTNNLKLVAYLFESQFFDHVKVAEMAEDILSTKSEDLTYSLVTALGICGPNFFKGPNPRCGQVAENLRRLSKVSSNRLRFAIDDVLEKKEKQHFKLNEIPSNFQQGSSANRTSAPASKPSSSYTVNRSGSYTAQNFKKPIEMPAEAFDEIVKQVTGDIKKYMNPFMHVKSKKFSSDQIKKLATLLLDEAALAKDQNLCNAVGDFLGEMIFNEQTKFDSILDLYGDYLDEDSEGEWLIENKRLPSDFSLLLSHILIKLVKSSTKKIGTFLSKKSLELLKVLFTGNNDTQLALCAKSLDQELRQNMDNDLYKELIVTCNLSPFLENV